MDPMTVTLLVVGTVVLAPVLTKASYLLYGVYEKRKKKSEKMKRVKEARKYNTDPEYRAKVDRQRVLAQAIDRSNVVTFTNDATGRQVNIPTETILDIDENKEVILRGKLYVRKSNSELISQPIFLIQPRLQTKEGKALGPFLSKKRRLYDNKPYLAKLPDTGELVRGYVPKRELVSGMNFDFVKGSNNFQTPELSRFLFIELETDENGNYIPVDFSDPKQAIGFKKYVANHKDQATAINYFASLQQMAVHSSKVLAVKDAVGTRKVEAPLTPKPATSAETEENPYDFYDRYNYHTAAAQIFGERGTATNINEDFARMVMQEAETPGRVMGR